MEEIKGYVEHIVYRNEDNGYTVFHLNNSDGEVTCVGNFHFIEEGELLRLTGGYTTHKMYGLQFAVEESEVCEPEDLISIERYLGSGAIKGIGAVLAGKIVKKFTLIFSDYFSHFLFRTNTSRRESNLEKNRNQIQPYRNRYC